MGSLKPLGLHGDVLLQYKEPIEFSVATHGGVPCLLCGHTRPVNRICTACGFLPGFVPVLIERTHNVFHVEESVRSAITDEMTCGVLLDAERQDLGVWPLKGGLVIVKDDGRRITVRAIGFRMLKEGEA